MLSIFSGEKMLQIKIVQLYFLLSLWLKNENKLFVLFMHYLGLILSRLHVSLYFFILVIFRPWVAECVLKQQLAI